MHEEQCVHRVANQPKDPLVKDMIMIIMLIIVIIVIKLIMIITDVTNVFIVVCICYS